MLSVTECNGILSLALSSKGGEGNRVAVGEYRDPCKVPSKGALCACQPWCFLISAYCFSPSVA